MGATAANSAGIANVVQQIEAIHSRHLTQQNHACTADEYKAKSESMGYLLQLVIKRVVKGLAYVSEDDGKQMFDASTGRVLVPFEQSTKAKSLTQLLYAWQIWITTYCQCTAGDERAWIVVLKDINRRNESGGTTLQYQAYLARLLKALDQSCLLYTSPSPRDQRGSRMPSSA